MTHGAPVDPSSDSWDRDLTAAFAVLLGRPVHTFPAEPEYALYYLNGAVVDGDQRLFERLGDADSLRRRWLPDDAAGRPEPLEICLGSDWGLDLATSIFEFEFIEESALAQALGAIPSSNLVTDAFRTVSGHELATTLTEHEMRPADIAAGVEDGAFTVRTAFRIVTDGTLRDALLTAIRAKHGPDELRPGPEEVAVLPVALTLFADGKEDLPAAEAAERDRVLASVRDPRLRAHLWSPYLDRPWDRADDGTVASTPGVPSGWKFLAARPGTVFVAAWDLAYFGEVSLAVMQNHHPTQNAPG